MNLSIVYALAAMNGSLALYLGAQIPSAAVALLAFGEPVTVAFWIALGFGYGMRILRMCIIGIGIDVAI
jgi:hypothetical protein